MSYLVLARKYRPRTFGEVVGQEVVTATLRGAIQEGRVGHAYLFSGPRGTGKTTSARIFAKALNCERGPAPDPCNECERCLAADAGSDVDLIEIDAASNTGVDDVRELRDAAIYVPLRARFKIYLVDEVHMLSKAAFNALLKTLEEPPPHVKFLFATTELAKIPETILSRCQILKLAPLEDERIRAKLEEIFEREGIRAEAGVAAEIARRARGGMRDALSLADQLLALVGSEPAVADMERLGSEGSERVLGAIVGALLARDKGALLAALPASEGGEVELVAALLAHVRAALVAALCGPEAAVLGRSASERAELAELGKRIGAERLEIWLSELLHLRERMRILPEHARVLLEVTLLDLATEEASVPLAELVERVAALEARLAASGGVAFGGAPGARASSAPPAFAPPSAPIASSTSSTRSPAAPSTPPRARSAPTERAASEPPRAPAPIPRVRGASTADTWKAFLADLATRAEAVSALLARRGSLRELGAGRAVIRVDGLTEQERALLDARNVVLCSKAFGAALGEAVTVEIEDAARSRPGSEDAFTRDVAELFDGRIEE